MSTVLFEPDRLLAGRLAAGEDAAFEAFFGEYFPRLYRFALARVGPDLSIVEDVVQETLSSAIQRIHHYRGEAALFTWLCTICRRTLERKERSDRRVRSRLAALEDSPEVRAALESIAGAAPQADGELAAEEQRRLVHVALDALPEHYARALEWKYLDDLKVRDVAERLGVTVKAAENVLTRARAAFRDVIRTLDPGPYAATRIS